MSRQPNSVSRNDELARGLERLLLDLAVRLVNVGIDELDVALGDALGAVGSQTNVDRVTVFRYDWEAGTACATYEWCAAGIEPAFDQLQRVPFEEVWPSYAQRHRQGKQTYIPDVARLPPGPFRDLLVAGGTRSVVDTPLIDGARCLGFVSLETVGRPLRWSEAHQDVLRVLAQLLVNVAHRQQHHHTELQLARVRDINTQLERFAGVVAHDLQAPLASSQGLLALVRNGRAPADQVDMLLARVDVGLQRMSGLIQQLLRYASAGHVLGTLGPVRLDEVVDDAIEACRQMISERGARIHRSALPCTVGDPLRLAEAVTNLISNAIRHTPAPQTPQIWISGTEHDHRVEVIIADDGPGIGEQDHDRALAPFEASDGSAIGPGTGLGLPIVASIIDAHDGELTLGRSEAGGLLVRIRLPRAEANRPA